MDSASNFNPTRIFMVDAVKPLPDWLQEGVTLLSEQDRAKMASFQFANKEAREFPIHTRANAAMSLLYTTAYAGAPNITPEVEQAIKVACEAHEVLGDLAPYLDIARKIAEEQTQQEIKEASDIADQFENYAIVRQEGEEEVGYLPVHAGAAVESSIHKLARWLSGPSNEIAATSEELVKAAAVIARKAQKFRLNLPPAIEKIATERYPDTRGVDFHIAQRMRCLPPVAASAEIRETYKEASDIAANDPDAVFAAVEAWRVLDESLGIRKYSSLQVSPFDVFFGGPTASEVEKIARSHVFYRDIPVPGVTIAGLSEERLTRHFGGAALELIKEAVDLAATDSIAASVRLDRLSPEEQDRFFAFVADYGAAA